MRQKLIWPLFTQHFPQIRLLFGDEAKVLPLFMCWSRILMEQLPEFSLGRTLGRSISFLTGLFSNLHMGFTSWARPTPAPKLVPSQEPLQSLESQHGSPSAFLLAQWQMLLVCPLPQIHPSPKMLLGPSVVSIGSSIFSLGPGSPGTWGCLSPRGLVN